MKKVLLTLIAALTMCGSAFAQYESHWPDFYDPDYEMQGGLVAAIMIDGQIINITDDGWDALEVAPFVGDECRGNIDNFLFDGVTEYGDMYPTLNGMPIFYNNQNEEVSFKMYDHINGILYEECEVLYLGEALTILTGEDHFEGWSDPENPIFLSFTTPAPAEPTPWGTEFEDEIPTVADDVTITEDVIIPNGYVAYANEIIIEEGATLYIEEGGQLIHNGEVEVTMLMNITGYGAKGENNAGYRLIATPVYTDETDHSIPVDGTNLNEGTFDLYKFVEAGDAEGNEWFNYQYEANNFTKLFRATGYLYASESTNNNISLAGMTTPTNYDVAVPVLQYTEGKRFAGWNLLGNPYTCNAYVTYNNANLPYYQMNSAGSELEAGETGSAIAPMKGIFVKATTEIQSCLFTTTAPTTSKGSLNIIVNQGRGKVDNAIIRFDGGQNLNKFQLNPNHTKVYMTQDGEDYAVVSAPEMGEMPVSFKAESNGTYTLNFTAKEVSFNYLHLIDNMTGADVNLLTTPSYSFNAQTTDYANRFKLVYATGNNSNDDSFAFFSNGNFVINNDGEATLQVIDVTGRILSSETINGSASVNVNAATGVYMLRLINGDNVKVQKVIVK